MKARFLARRTPAPLIACALLIGLPVISQTPAACQRTGIVLRTGVRASRGSLSFGFSSWHGGHAGYGSLGHFRPTIHGSFGHWSSGHLSWLSHRPLGFYQGPGIVVLPAQGAFGCAPFLPLGASYFGYGSYVPFGGSYYGYSTPVLAGDYSLGPAPVRRVVRERIPRTRLTAEEAADQDDYYLYQNLTAETTEPAVNEALADIQAAFRSGDADRLARHVNAAGKVAILSAASTRSMTGAEWLAATREALRDMKTVRFTLTRAEPGSGGAWRVSGTHVLRGEDGQNQAYRVAFLLERTDGRWVITAAGADRAP